MTEDLLRALIQGQGSSSGSGQSSGGALSELLQGLLGGAAQQSDTSQQATATSQDAGGQGGATGLGGLLEGLLGGGGLSGAGQQSAGAGGGLTDLLGAIMGGGASGGQADPVLGSVVTGLAEKLGLSPQIAQTVVSFVMNKLLTHHVQTATTSQQAVAGQTGQAQVQGTGTGLGGLLQMLNSGQTVKQSDLHASGLVQELVQQTGLSPSKAAASLQHVFNTLGSQYGGTQ